MKGLGLSTTLVDGRPHVVGVIVERKAGQLSGREVFRFTSDAQQDLALQLASLSSALASKMPAFAADAAIVRTLDHSPKPRKETDLAVRYAAEGVLLAVSRRFIERTDRLRGKDIGDRCGSDKGTVEARAAVMCGEEGKVAGAAAIAALTWAEAP
jgi:hypothetical protein